MELRIALGLKNLECKHIGINLRNGEQHAEAYRNVNPAGLVPVLNHDGWNLTQSLAIVDYLDLLQPETLPIPKERGLRTEVQEISLYVVCEMHPLNNMRVQRYLKDELRLTDDRRHTWDRPDLGSLATTTSAVELRCDGP